MYLNTAAGKAQNADLPKDVSPSIARLYLNELVEKARIELNDMIFVCKRYEGLNREILGKAHLQLINQVGGLSCSLTEKQQQLTRSYCRHKQRGPLIKFCVKQESPLFISPAMPLQPQSLFELMLLRHQLSVRMAGHVSVQV